MSTATGPSTVHSIRSTIKMRVSASSDQRPFAVILMDSLSTTICTTLTVFLCVTTGSIMQRRSNNKRVGSGSGSIAVAIVVGTVYSVT